MDSMITLTDKGAEKVREFLSAQSAVAETAGLRVGVRGGGCSGFQYEFKMDDQVNGDDVTFERDGSVLVTDETSLDLIAGAEVDFVDDLMGAYFQVRNPNAVSSCGCGTSFAIA